MVAVLASPLAGLFFIKLLIFKDFIFAVIKVLRAYNGGGYCLKTYYY